MRHLAFMIALTASLRVWAAADSIPDINVRLLEADDPMLRVPSLAYRNPALMSMAADFSLSGVYAKGGTSHRSGNPQSGTGGHEWRLGADSYMHTGKMTLWGNASYTGGVSRNVIWNETADIDMVYPYIAADSVGGDINSERYSFGGGCVRLGDTWGWGVTAQYTAAQHYRNVDPRPRNITGLLDVSLGGSRLLDNYAVSASASLRRYTQSNDIDFKSEMGVVKVYHLTGLGNHYYRFAGQGLSANYSGLGYGVSVNLFPRHRRGAAVSVELTRFTFGKVLTDLNRLPLADVWQNKLRTQIAWLAPSDHLDWAVTGNFDVYRRHGTENIFGDASSNIYPQIGSMELYADNCRDASASMLVSRHSHGWRLWALAGGGYIHRREIYAFPAASRLYSAGYGRLTAGCAAISGKWEYSGNVSGFAAQRQGMGCSAQATANLALSGSQAIGLTAGYCYTRDFRNLDISLTLSF